MKKLLLFFVICFSTSLFAQDLVYTIPNNAPFALCINGKNMNDKVALQTIQNYPWMQELLEKHFKFIPKELSQTGIDFTTKHYQYFVNKDSVMNYVILLPLTDAVLFEKMVQSKYGDSLKVTQKDRYTRVSTSKNHHLAWNKKFALMVNSNYTKPYNKNDNDPYANLTSIDTTGILIDTNAITVDTAATAYIQEEEIKTVVEKKTPSKKNKKNKKGTNSKKNEPEPLFVEPTEEELYARQEKANAELEETNRKLLELENHKTDSIEWIKINPIVESIFKETFEKNIPNKLSPSVIFEANNPKSDFYVYADLDAITNQVYASFLDQNATFKGIFKNSILNSTYYANGFFDKDKIRLSQVIAPKDELTKTMYQKMFDTKIDKNLLNYVGTNVLAYYSIAIETQSIMEYEYQIMKNTLNSVYQNYNLSATTNEAEVLIDAIALLIDEKAIAELIPGNALFVLHDLKKVERDFVTYEYNDNYEQTEILSKKEEILPEFTFLVNTKNESFFNKLLQLPVNKSQFTQTDYQATNGYYTLHFEKDNLLENLYLGLKNGVVMLTTSKENIENLIQQKVMPIAASFKKSVAKNNATFWVDLQKIIALSKSEIEKDTKNNTYNLILKNAGTLNMECKFKNNAIVSETSYSIKGEHSNSLQYLFDLINELDAESKKETLVTD